MGYEDPLGQGLYLFQLRLQEGGRQVPGAQGQLLHPVGKGGLDDEAVNLDVPYPPPYRPGGTRVPRVEEPLALAVLYQKPDGGGPVAHGVGGDRVPVYLEGNAGPDQLEAYGGIFGIGDLGKIGPDDVVQQAAPEVLEDP